MVTHAGKVLNLALLLIFLCVAAGVPSLHTEGPGGNDPLCPACHFQNAALSTGQIDFFQLPDLVLLDVLALPSAPGYEYSDSPVTGARAPPAA